MNTTCISVVVYLLGLAILGVLSYKGLTDWYSRETMALWIVLPLAWLFSYFPMLGSVLMLLRWRTFMRSLERLEGHLRGKEALPEAELATVETFLVELAATENRLPRCLVRPLVKRLMTELLARAERTGGHTT